MGRLHQVITGKKFNVLGISNCQGQHVVVAGMTAALALRALEAARSLVRWVTQVVSLGTDLTTTPCWSTVAVRAGYSMPAGCALESMDSKRRAPGRGRPAELGYRLRCR